MLNKYNNEIVREMYQGIIKIVNCYHNGFTMTDFNNYIDVINSKSNYDDLFRSVLLDTSNQIFEIFNQFKEIIANFAEIDTQQNNNIDEDPIISVYSEVEALVKAYDLKELAAKVNALPASDTQQNDSFEQFQPGIHAFMDAYDIDTAAAFNTKIYQLIASDIQDSKTNSALQQQLETLCNQVETLTGQVQQLSEQIQQLKNPPTKSE
ncbi:MAG: hypothetical protein MR484_08690 [Ruminococcus sp.]|nr:hypothetical protein [Ruminococcus sp.]